MANGADMQTAGIDVNNRMMRRARGAWTFAAGLECSYELSEAAQQNLRMLSLVTAADLLFTIQP